MTALFAAIPQTWQVKDRSDSGCRMRGQIENLNRVIPGSLIAIRDSATAPWIVSVVRRFRRLMVDHVEIGVEYLGRKPRYVKLVADIDPNGATNAVPDDSVEMFRRAFPAAERTAPDHAYQDASAACTRIQGRQGGDPAFIQRNLQNASERAASAAVRVRPGVFFGGREVSSSAFCDSLSRQHVGSAGGGARFAGGQGVLHFDRRSARRVKMPLCGRWPHGS